MGFWDTNESSSSTSNTSTTTTTTVPTSGAEGGALSIAAAGGVEYNALDAGAIGQAFGASGQALDLVGQGVRDSLDFVQKESALSFEKFFKFASESLGLVGKTVNESQAAQERALEKSVAFAEKSQATTAAAVGESQSGGAQRLLYLGAAALMVFAFIARKGV